MFERKDQSGAKIAKTSVIGIDILPNLRKRLFGELSYNKGLKCTVINLVDIYRFYNIVI